jgi:hypothetical protein
VLLWISLFVVVSILCAWVLFGGGAERLEDSILNWQERWKADGIRLVVGAIWCAAALCFVAGLFDADIRTLFTPRLLRKGW